MDRNRMTMLPNGRPSGIRPPSTYKQMPSNIPQRQSRLPTASDSLSSASTGKHKQQGVFRPQFGSGGRFGGGGGGGAMSGMSGMSRPSGTFQNNRTSNVFALPKFGGFSARKSSIAGPKMGLFGMTPNNKRPSSTFNPGTASSMRSSRRGSSIGGARHLKDSRPLSDKAYHTECVKKLVTFLNENEFPHTINKSLHVHPSVSDVTRIFEFLFSFYDPKVKVLPLDIQIPKLMEIVGFPYPAKKSDLVSFTGARSLGSLLGMFDWLVDSLEYAFQIKPETWICRGFEMENEVNIKQQLIQLCMTNMNQDDLEEVDECVQEELEELYDNKYGSEQDYMKMLEEEEKLARELEKLDAEKAMIDDVPKVKENYRKDIENYRVYNVQMSEKVNEYQCELEEINAMIVKKEEQAKELNVNQQMLMRQVKDQEFGKDEADLARDRKMQLEEEIREETKEIDELRKSIRSTKNENNKLSDKLNSLFSDSISFINAINELVNAPTLKEYIEGLKKMVVDQVWTEIAASLQSLQKDRSSTNLAEFEKLFTEKVNQLEMGTVEQLGFLQGRATLNEQQKLSEIQGEIEDHEAFESGIKAQVEQLNEEMETKRKEQSSHINSLQSECERNSTTAKELENNQKQSLYDHGDKSGDLKKKLQELQTTMEKYKTDSIAQLKELIAKESKEIKNIQVKLDEMLKKENEKHRKLTTLNLKMEMRSNRQKGKAVRKDKREDKNDKKKLENQGGDEDEDMNGIGKEGKENGMANGKNGNGVHKKEHTNGIHTDGEKEVKKRRKKEEKIINGNGNVKV